MFLVFVASVVRVFEFVSVFSFYIFSVFHAFRGRWNCLRVLVGISSVSQVFFKRSCSLLVFSLLSLFFAFLEACGILFELSSMFLVLFVFSSSFLRVFMCFLYFLCFSRFSRPVELSSSFRYFWASWGLLGLILSLLGPPGAHFGLPGTSWGSL